MSDLIGIIPAAGNALRLGHLPCSKEIFPVGFFHQEENGKRVLHPKPVCMYLIDQMKQAYVSNIILIINKNKTDIIRYMGDGSSFGVSINYLIQESPKGMPFALDLAWPWTKNSKVIFGMPDTIFSPTNAYSSLLETHQTCSADVCLGLFPTETPHKFGMVSFDTAFQFKYTIDKPSTTDLKFMWGIGSWNSTFSDFMHDYLRAQTTSNRELILGDVFQNAYLEGLKICVHPFYEGEYIDIGSLDDLNAAITRFSIK